jgi:hypothetical protein
MDRCPRRVASSTTFTLDGPPLFSVIALAVLGTAICCAPRLLSRLRGRREPGPGGAEMPRRRGSARTRRRDGERDRDTTVQEIVVAARVASISGLPEMRAGQHTKPSDRCAICLEEYKQADLLLTLPCMHVYHKRCAQRWLLEPNSGGQCPVCKEPI